MPEMVSPHSEAGWEGSDADEVIDDVWTLTHDQAAPRPAVPAGDVSAKTAVGPASVTAAHGVQLQSTDRECCCRR